jgi:Mg-chelatase subunit ChlI
VGTLDIEKAIQKGERRFEPGVLASANRGLLYIDEVNLLDDHIVDVLLDSAAMGMNIVERLKASLRKFLDSINAPREQYIRLEL